MTELRTMTFGLVLDDAKEMETPADRPLPFAKAFQQLATRTQQPGWRVRRTDSLHPRPWIAAS